MAYNTKEVKKDRDGNPISQYYNPTTDEYGVVEGSSGANKVILWDKNGNESEQLDLRPILSTLERLTGTVVDEETRKFNENSRKSSESDRESAESTRQSQENTRQDNESQRESNESSRESAENVRETNELDRQSEEDIRKSNEATRQSNESDRKLAETSREDAENLRVSAETDREAEEDIRKSNETTRISKESTREENENIRKSNELDRESNESTRQSNESDRKSSEVIRESNESTRIDNMNIVEGWIANPEQFNGKDIEYNWRGTELGIRLVGNTEYEYVNLKGETGSVENLTPQHIQNALGFIPKNYVAGENIEIIGSTIKGTVPPVDISGKVDKVPGKDLSTNDYTTAEKDKLSGIEAGANNYELPSTLPYSILTGTPSIPSITHLLPKSGGTLENYVEKTNTTTGTINLNLGNVFIDTPSANRTYTITNAKSGVAHSFTLQINMGTVVTLTFPSSVKWQGGEIPDMSTANKTYVLTFMSVDGGTNWLGMFGGEF